jgi:glycosyltransferase involved in cell wall biosynthesis
MKIAMIGQKGIPALFGGVERHVEEVALRLAKMKNCVFVYTRKYYTPKNVKKYKKVNLISLPSLATKHLDTITHIFLSSLHTTFKLKPDVVHYHGIGSGLCIWIPKIFNPKIKVVFTFHCQDYFHKKWNFFARFSLKTGEFFGCILADEVLVVSPEIQKYVEKKYKRKAHFIPHGATLEENFEPVKIKKWGLEKNDYILVVSRLIPHKGVHYLIKAYNELSTNKKLVVVGSPFHTLEYEKELKKLAAKNPGIIFLGNQSGRTLKELFSNAYLFVYPSEQEGMPLAVLEAASFSRPILLSDIEVHKWMLGKNPFFFQTKNAKDLKASLDFLLRNPQLLSHRAKLIKEYAQKHYDWDVIVEEIVLKYA